MNAIGVGESFHKADVSLACLLNPTANSKSRYKHIVCTNVSIPGVHSSLCVDGFDRVTVKALKDNHVIM